MAVLSSSTCFLTRYFFRNFCHGGYFCPLVIFGLDFSADLLSKYSTVSILNYDKNWFNLTQLVEDFKSCFYVSLKMTIFFFLLKPMPNKVNFLTFKSMSCKLKMKQLQNCRNSFIIFLTHCEPSLSFGVVDIKTEVS